MGVQSIFRTVIVLCVIMCIGVDLDLCNVYVLNAPPGENTFKTLPEQFTNERILNVELCLALLQVSLLSCVLANGYTSDVVSLCL